MNGTWKEKIGGWSKDSKRKAQTRHHTLKDKLKRLNRVADNNVEKVDIRREGECSVTCIEKTNIQFTIDVCVVSVDASYVKDEMFQPIATGKTRLAYKWHNGWYDYHDGTPIEGGITLLHTHETEYVNWDEDKPRFKEVNPYWSRVADHHGKTFVYGKPLPTKFYKIFGFYASKARKHVQKYVNGMDRTNIAKWINNADWDAEVKTHALSKTIAWEIW